MPINTRFAAASALLLFCGAALAVEPALPVINPDALLTMDKSVLQQDKAHPERYYYINHDVVLAKYSRVMIAPLVVVTEDTHKQWQALVGEKESRPEQMFLQTMRQALQKRGLTVVDEPGEDVLVLRLAVTHVQQEHDSLNPTDLLPIKMVFNLTRRLAGKEPYIVKISTMGVLNDSLTGKLVAGSLGLRQEDKYGADPVSMDDFQPWLDSWSQVVADQVTHILPTSPASPPLQ
ncbi:DUF3313 family protein [Paludibacterium purpuratum]|uniref:Uncharacterized protein DUF3313 n=1 Tax=Paludibacterium purpuratum TaxID=1144873 RepID=A0A4V3DUI9_9NEIS|nr:DUF3313 family protein [Paludibacterium purpuratum]TDR73495.1 uncharacterized protein DUF3313 [Paludibacterium purpuratum]